MEHEELVRAWGIDVEAAGRAFLADWRSGDPPLAALWPATLRRGLAWHDTDRRRLDHEWAATVLPEASTLTFTHLSAFAMAQFGAPALRELGLQLLPRIRDALAQDR
jgi:hypothetical protein